MSRTCCGKATYVHDRARAALPDGNYRHNSETGLDGRHAAAGNIQGGRKNLENYFCCVTTRNGLEHLRDKNLRLGLPFRAFRAAVVAALPRPTHDPCDFSGSDGAPAGVWPPASDEVHAGNPDLDSTAGSSGVVGRSDRSPCGDRPAAANADRSWPTHPDPEYPGLVPWELLSLGARPGRLLFSFLGHLHVMASPLLGYTAPSVFQSTHTNCRLRSTAQIGEGNVAVAAASAFPEVDREGNIHIDVGKQRKDTRKVKETWKGTTEVVVA